MTTDDIIERIRKLLRLAENEGATESEAATALERANALLIRHNLSMDRVATGNTEQPAVTEGRIKTGWAGSWRGSLLGILARHNLCSTIISRWGRTDTIIVVGRTANVQATHAMYDWIAAQLEQFAASEWVAYNRAQREAIANHPNIPWCPECEDWTEAYRERGSLCCYECDGGMLTERPPIHGFTWKTAFYRGALQRINNRLYEQRKAQEQVSVPQATTQTDETPAGATVTALVLRTAQENDDYIREHIGPLRDGRPSRLRGYHAGAWQRGKERGGDVSLAPQPRLRPTERAALS